MQITELRLKTHCLSELRRFYGEVLAFQILREKPRSITLSAGHTRLIFEQDSTDRYFYHFAFTIPHNRFNEAKTWLAERAPLLRHAGKDEVDWSSWDAKACYFLDPAGNIGEFIARYKLPNASAAPFCAQSVVCVSEIGLAVDRVDQAMEDLKNNLELPLWDGDGEIFAALGDAEGLLIIVKRGRPWFPTTDRPAKAFPVHMTIRGNTPKNYNPPEYPCQIRIK